MKKLRADSTFARLSEEDLAQVDDMLLSGSSYEEVRAFMAECGLTCSQTSVADYYHTHILPRKYARQQRIARALDAVDTTGLDDATLDAVRARAMELAITPGAEVKHIKALYELVLKAQAQRLDERRVVMLEKKAAAADAAQAAMQDTALSEEERMDRVRRIFGLV
ncbi:MAG: hypothetical protein IJB64_10070 [Akkermansia sp.]|nr:hypothetical protein [Akkermansia sp.]